MRLVDAPLDISFSPYNDEEEILREFNHLSESDDDPVGQWVKMAKARGETSESDQVLLTLLVELHRKVDELSDYVKKSEKNLLSLDKKAQIQRIGFEYFELKNEVFIKDKIYYGRILMPVFPKREVPMFFKALDEKIAFIQQIHERDEKDYNAYVTARERVMIRQMKAKNAD